MELEHVFDQFPKYHMKILLGDFKAKTGRESIFKPTVGNESLHEISNDNWVRVVKFALSKNLSFKRVAFISNRMSYITLRGHWCDIVLNVHAPTEDKSDDKKDSIYKELEHVFNQFSKDHMKILLGDFNAKAE